MFFSDIYVFGGIRSTQPTMMFSPLKNLIAEKTRTPQERKYCYENFATVKINHKTITFYLTRTPESVPISVLNDVLQPAF